MSGTRPDMAKSINCTMFQSKCKHLNEKIKMLSLLLILMWPLMGQHVCRISPSYAIGIVTVAAAADTNGMDKMIQENMAEITTTNYEKEATLIATTTIVDNKSKSTKATAATIYGHINENDNNSNKLPQNVATTGQQQPNMMYVNIKKAAVPSQTQSTTSSSTTRTAKRITAAEASLVPTESLPMPEDQFNKTESSDIPKNDEKEQHYDKKPGDSSNERKILKVKFNETRAREAFKCSRSNSHNKKSVNDIKNTINSETFVSDLHTSTSRFQADQREYRNSRSNIEPERNIDNSANFKSFDSIAHAHQELISQFALRFKRIPRVTYFTCQEPSVAVKPKSNHKTYNIYKQHSNMNLETVEFVRRIYSSVASNDPSLLIKVVLIDNLVKKNHASTSNTTTSRVFGRTDTFRPATRNTFANDNWLEQVLRPEPLRQVVVLNLSCGAASRRLLEMASNKSLLNAKYHWLLLKDFLFNRQTEIDDVDDIENKMSSYGYSTVTDKSVKEETVNDSTVRNLQVKNAIAGARAPTASSTFKMTVDIRQQQRLVDTRSSASLNTSRSGITGDDDTEIIEKFLEKLNININTELILAKRCMRAIMPSTYSSTATLLNMMPKPPPSSPVPPALTNSTPTDWNGYSTLSKMDYYSLYDVWNPGLQYGGVLNKSEIGYFTRSEGLKLHRWYSTTSIVRRRPNMQMARVRCLVVVTHKNDSSTLEEYMTSHYDTHLDSMNRFNFALLTHVRDLFNFSFILSNTSSWGYLKNGKFDGMIGALVQRQADIGGSPIFFRLERAKVIDYTARTWVARPCFIFRHPRGTKSDRIVFLQPFSNEVWICLFVCGCIIIVLLWLLKSVEVKFDPKCVGLTHSLKVNARTEQKTESFTKQPAYCVEKFGGLNIRKAKYRGHIGLFLESLLFYVGSLCQQGLSFATVLFSGRCIVLTSLLFSFAIYQFYSASIVGTLLMEKPKTIRTLRDLIHSTLEIGVEDIAYNRDYFLRTKDPDARELYIKKVTSVPMTRDTTFADTSPVNFASPTQITELTNSQEDKAYHSIPHTHETAAYAKTNVASNWYDPDYGVAKIKKGRFAFHVDVATAYKIIGDTFSEREICDLTEVQLFPPQKMVSIVQKGSPLRKVITYGLRRVTEVGLTDYQRKVWHSAKPRCVKQIHAEDLRVDMQTFASALLVLIYGYAVSLLILSLEIVHFKLWQRYTTLTT